MNKNLSDETGLSIFFKISRKSGSLDVVKVTQSLRTLLDRLAGENARLEEQQLESLAYAT